MKKEKHVLKNPYNHHTLSRYIDVYEVSANGCHSVPESGYKGTEATLVDEPAWNEKFSSYSITGATLTGNNFILNNDVTAQANYETAKNVTTVRCNSTKNSGFIGDTASLTNSSPAWNEKFSSYSITGSTLTGSNFKFTGSNITAQANFETAKNVTLQTDGHGNIAANKNSGFIGDQVTLSNTPNANYNFAYYSITGATLTGNKFNFVGNNVTAKANFSAEPVKLFISGGFGNNAGVSPGDDFFGTEPKMLGNTFSVAASEYGNKTTAAKAVDCVITAFGRPLYWDDYTAYSSYYDSTAKQGVITYFGYGLKKPIHITDIQLISDNTITAYNISDLSYGSGINGPWYQGTKSESIHRQTQHNLDFVTNDKIAVRFHSTGAIVDSWYSGYFTGYILV